MKLYMEGPIDHIVYWDEVGEWVVDSLIVLKYYTQQVQMIRERLRTAQS